MVFAAYPDVLHDLRPFRQVGNQREIDNEGFIRQILHLFYALFKGLWAVPAGHIDGPHTTGVGNKGGKLGPGNILHPPLHNGLLNTEQLGKFGLDHGFFLLT